VSTSTRVTVRRFSGFAVEAERIVAELAVMTGTRAPGFLHAPAPRQHIARYFPAGYYRNYPAGVIVLRAAEPRNFINTMCHEYQHHLDALAGVRVENPMSRHDDAFYARVEALKERYLAYRTARAARLAEAA
jgi:hypothetical protein